MNETIIVQDRRENRLPFSRGIMATSLLATGVPTEEAYRLSSTIQRHLLAQAASARSTPNHWCDSRTRP